jgi:hypothetical protein
MEKRSGFLKVMSVIILIGGIIYLIIAGAGLAAGGLLNAMSDSFSGLGVLSIVAGVLMLIAGIIGVLAGRTGLKACKDVNKTKGCVVLGIIMIIPSVLAFIFTLITLHVMSNMNHTGDPVNYMSAIVSLLIGVAIPALYIVAAKIRKTAA